MAPLRTIRRIVLTGFMGAGKSTAGPLLAHSLAWEFIDADSVIESRAGKSIAEIFAEQGESAFRTLEAETIRDHSRRQNLVLALGGGALETESTRSLLASLDRACVIFLDAPLDLLVARCLAQTGAAIRPVLADRESLRRRFDSRLPWYRAAHVTIATAGLTPQAVVARILEDIKAFDKRRISEAAAEGVPTR